MNHTSAIARCRALFERELAARGTPVVWRKRTANVPQSGGALSTTAGQRDPVEGSWVPLHLDGQVFAFVAEIRISLRLPTDRDGDPVALLTGVASAKCSTDNVVEVGDLLETSSGKWRVKGSEEPTAAVYRQLTLERVA